MNETASAFLAIALTKRGKNKGEDIPLCGIPVHALNHYLIKQLKPGLAQKVRDAGAHHLHNRFLFSVINDLINKDRVALAKAFRADVIKKWQAIKDCPGFERRSHV